MRNGLWAAVCVAGLAMTQPAPAAEAVYTLLSFEDLNGWEADDHQAALTAFLETCPALKDPDWSAVCALAATHPNARTFFELFFRPVLIEDSSPALFTGYFEPELRGSLVETPRFRYPVYRKPPEMREGTPWLTRREIEESGALRGRGLELAWVDNPVDVFFLQIQGSGRIDLTNGQTMRVGYGGSNGRNYQSVGKELIRRGVYAAHQVSAAVIRSWVKRNPFDGMDLLLSNPSFVFFRKVGNVSGDKGPLGAMNRSVTAGRTLAVDPKFTPLGAPVWLEKGGKGQLQRLMVAQDTGSAIKGAQRADIFFGTGDAAGRMAGRVRDGGRMVVLMPIQRAFAMATGAEG